MQLVGTVCSLSYDAPLSVFALNIQIWDCYSYETLRRSYSWWESVPCMRKVGCSSPCIDGPNSLKQVVTAALPNGWQRVWVSRVFTVTVDVACLRTLTERQAKFQHLHAALHCFTPKQMTKITIYLTRQKSQGIFCLIL